MRMHRYCYCLTLSASRHTPHLTGRYPCKSISCLGLAFEQQRAMEMWARCKPLKPQAICRGYRSLYVASPNASPNLAVEWDKSRGVTDEIC